MIATLQGIVLTSMRHTDRRTDELQMDNSKSDVSRSLQLRHKYFKGGLQERHSTVEST